MGKSLAHIPVKEFSRAGLTGVQMKNKMFISTHILDKQVEILDNENISPRLKTSDEYIKRHIGNSEDSTQEALKVIGVSSVEELMDQVVPADIRLTPGNRFKHKGKELQGIDSEALMLNRMR